MKKKSAKNWAVELTGLFLLLVILFFAIPGPFDEVLLILAYSVKLVFFDKR